MSKDEAYKVVRQEMRENPRKDWRAMANSNLVDYSTGRSAALCVARPRMDHASMSARMK
jgi:hypothetical protein